MSAHSNKATDLRLLNTILAFVAEHPDNVVDRFREPVANWGHDWCGVEPTYLPASEMLEQMLMQSSPATNGLLSLFTQESRSLHWEQAYTQAAAPIGGRMLANYGYAEIIGKQGPILSAYVRAGIAIYGPWIDYPLHQHRAEEVYVVLAGAAGFRLGDNEPVTRTPGEVTAPQLGQFIADDDATLYQSGSSPVSPPSFGRSSLTTVHPALES